MTGIFPCAPHECHLHTYMKSHHLGTCTGPKANQVSTPSHTLASPLPRVHTLCTQGEAPRPLGHTGLIELEPSNPRLNLLPQLPGWRQALLALLAEPRWRGRRYALLENNCCCFVKVGGARSSSLSTNSAGVRQELLRRGAEHTMRPCTQPPRLTSSARCFRNVVQELVVKLGPAVGLPPAYMYRAMRTGSRIEKVSTAIGPQEMTMWVE